MSMFLTKVWGFDEPCGPLQFGEPGWRDRARRLLKNGSSRVVLVGTLGDRTPEHMRGCVLGLMEPTLEPVGSLDFDLPTQPQDFVNGHYKWPYALHNRRAWKFTEPYTRLKDLTDRRFAMDAAAGIVAIDDNLARRIESLPHFEVPLLKVSATARTRLKNRDAPARRSSPSPTTIRRGIMHLRRAEAYTYGFSIEGAETAHFKIGWAFDFESRKRQFNRAALPGLGGLRYTPWMTQFWDTATQAFRMEQLILRTLDIYRHPQNHEVVEVGENELVRVWTDAMLKVRQS